MHPITATHDWITGHTVTVIIITFVASGLVSLYSSEIKLFLRTWPIKTLRVYNRRNNMNRLQLLKNLHNDTYRLVIYLALSAVSLPISVLTWALAIITINGWTTGTFHLPEVGPIFWGIGLGKAYQVSEVLQELLKFDTRSVELQNAIEDDDRKIALKQQARLGSPKG